jgi:hypothetical protein
MVKPNLDPNANRFYRDDAMILKIDLSKDKFLKYSEFLKYSFLLPNEIDEHLSFTKVKYIQL